jgi:uncharacterized membrane protein
MTLTSKHLSIIALLAGFPSGLKHALGGEVEEAAARILSSSILYLLIVSVGSPIWLYLIEREKRIRKLADDASKE